MRSLLAPFRWWLKHPWQAFWLTVPAFFIWVGVFGFEDAPLHSSTFGTVGVAAVILLSIASFLWGIGVSWDRSRGGAIIKVAIPVLLCLILFSIGVTLPANMRARAHTEKANADARAIGLALKKLLAFPEPVVALHRFKLLIVRRIRRRSTTFPIGFGVHSANQTFGRGARLSRGKAPRTSSPCRPSSPKA